jgi:cytochrome bd-type quinol oxidase subunit 2
MMRGARESASIWLDAKTREERLVSPIFAMSALGWTAGAILFLIIWVLIAFWPARVARRKGHSFILYFIFSLIIFPLALLTAYLVRDRTRG